MKRYVLIPLILIVGIGVLHAQTISGKVLDAKTTEPLSFANVFLNNTTSGTVSDANGNFILKNISPGTYDLVVSYVGYEPRKIKIYVRESYLFLSAIAVTPSLVALSNVDVKSTRDKTWERQMKKFTDIFLGQKKQAASCKILNPWVIDFPKTADWKFVAQANAPIEVLNEGLGYKIFYYLTEFWSKEGEYAINGNVRFEELFATNEAQTQEWAKNREIAFRKSYNYFFKSVLTEKSKGSGFKISYERINVNKVSYWIPFDTAGIVSVGERIGEYNIAMKGNFEIRTHRRDEIGRLDSKGDHITINSQGFVLNPTDLWVTGVYEKYRLASLLPISYQYQETGARAEEFEETILAQFYEKIYMHTDKPYYYPGEPMWFKGYINYKEPAWRDSLSKVIYVELIDPKKQISLSKILKIDSGLFHNDFILPDTLKEGMYHLRAYTNLSRNFGDSTLFVKDIPILNISHKIDYTQGKMEATKYSLLTIKSDKETYTPREKITLTMQLKDEDDMIPVSNLSVSVTDVTQVVPIAEPITIQNGYLIETEKQKVIKELKYPMEYAVGFTGKFRNDHGEPEKAKLTIFQMRPRNVMMTETTEQGLFTQSTLNFYDTTTFFFKADKAEKYPYGKVALLPQDIPATYFKENSYNLTIQNTDTPQRIISEYEVPKDAKMLKGVEVRASRIEKPVDRIVRPYGRGDIVIEEKDINPVYPNLLYTLAAAKAAGLFVDVNSKVVVFRRSATQSINFQQGPLVTINNIPISGDAGEILSIINPNDVKSIELTKRINVLYAAMGNSGVIAVFTKQGPSEEDLKVTPNFQAIKIAGYSTARLFKSPDYSNTKTDTTKGDYRSTLYWNPNVVTDGKTGTATVSFFASDLPGKYRIVAEGITQNGEPVRCVSFIEVDR